MINRNYTPNDVAMYLNQADFTYSIERKILNEIVSELQDQRVSKIAFIKEVDDILETFDPDILIELNELNLKLSSDSQLISYFNVIKLRLHYTEGCDHVRVKFRTILKRFGYKRRSEKLINELDEILNQLGLTVSLKGGIGCKLNEIPLDEFIMIRLRSEEDV